MATLIGVIDDGIASGFDMIITEGGVSDAIARAGGISAGMSGSPVYAADGRLVGAVSYVLATTSPIAGITPCRHAGTLQRRRCRRPLGKVKLTAALEKKIVRGAERAQEVASGLTRLPIPVGVSGMGSRYFALAASPDDQASPSWRAG